MNLASYAGIEFTETGPDALQDIGGPAQPLLMVRGLRKRFKVLGGFFSGNSATVQAVDGVSFEVAKGETLAIVGEAGCGKSTTARLIARLMPADAGELIFDGLGVAQFGGMPLKAYRGQLQMVFKDAQASLNPHMTIVEAVAYGPRVRGVPPRRALQRAHACLDRVGLAPGLRAQRYPHELSVDQQQRASIARALALEPRLLILDEPLAALDKAAQAQLLNLLQQLKSERRLSYLFISRDLLAVRHFADRVLVMKQGQVIESGPVQAVFGAARHPCTRDLLSAVPAVDAQVRTVQAPAAGVALNPVNASGGCRFRERCPLARQVCELRVPPMRESTPGHWAACHFDTALPIAQPFQATQLA